MSASNAVTISIQNHLSSSHRLSVVYTDENQAVQKAWSGNQRFVAGLPGSCASSDAPTQTFTATLTDADTTSVYTVELYAGDDTKPIFVKSYAFAAVNNPPLIEMGVWLTMDVVGLIFNLIIVALLTFLVVWVVVRFFPVPPGSSSDKMAMGNTGAGAGMETGAKTEAATAYDFSVPAMQLTQGTTVFDPIF